MNFKQFEFKKKYGQNFIKEDSIIDKIIRVSDISSNSLIIEIGPGGGSLTKKLVDTNNTVIAYEIDETLEKVLLDQFSSYDNFHLIIDDFLKRDLKSDVSGYSYEKIYVIANLPYYITTPIINKIIEEIDVYKMIIMVQKELADRLAADVGTKDYGSLTVFLNYYFDIKREFIVSRNCFIPSPNVDSAVVSLTRKNELLEVKDKDKFYKLIRDSFQFKRKNLKNNLRGYDLDIISSVLACYNHDLSDRAEVISVSEFVDISNHL